MIDTLSQLAPEVHTALPAARGQQLVDALAATECPALTARRARRAERSGAPHDPIVWARASGVNVWDADGNRFVDLSAGFGAAAVGHGHPRVVQAVQAQAGTLLHALGDLHPSELKIALLSRLATLAPMPGARVMLGLNGGDVVTAALKTAVLHTRKPGVLAFDGAYHGLDYGPLAACGYSEKFRAPFAAQLNPHVVFAPYPGQETPLGVALDAVRKVWDKQSSIGAVLIEPLLGRGGVVVPPSGFLQALSELCRARGALLILDEVMTALGRTGVMFSGGAQGVRADLVCIGKALGGGLPVSACLGTPEVMAAWGDPDSEALHTGTFFGNPLGCAAALAALEVVDDEKLCEASACTGGWLAARLWSQLGERVRDVRGAGLLCGIDLGSGARGLWAVRALLQRGYITVPAGEDARVVSLTPPLGISEHILTGFVDAFASILDELGP